MCRIHPVFAFSVAALICGSLPLGAQTPTFNRNATVHDPSVIKVGERFYVYGSHGASAWTEDLMNWTQVATGVNQGNPRHFNTFQSELSELISWTNAGTLWAADVIQLEDGDFYYYYNVWTDLNSYRSYMGLAVADTVEGPYSDVGEILRGGAGVSGFDPRIHPNTIDPTLFWDDENNLWMVYGSYSGGIFILEMNEQTGFPEPDQSWGKRLAGGNHAVMEGPFIDYNAETGYYYLFLSFGGLGAADGYNMRVFRSAHPDGPYYDPKGTDMSTASVNSSLASIAPHGLKLAGNWQFVPVEGEAATSTTGYLSPGHNSVIQDPDTGKWFNFFHTRFVGRGEQHEVRVHQMFFNEDGWPVMAPHRYAGETQGTYTAEQVAGSYKVINHGKDITADVKTSSVLGLQEGGGLVGASGSWSMVDGRNMRLTVNGAAFRGVVCEQWDNENRRWVHAFTAMSSEGEALWGSEVAVVDRAGDLEPPDLEPIPDMAIGSEEALALSLNERTGNPDLVLEYKILEGPQGLQLNPETGALTWEPLASQRGKVYTIRIQIYDVIEPNLADEVHFSLYAAGGFAFSERDMHFESEADSGIVDSEGQSTGLSARLPGTGSSYGSGDPNLRLDPENSRLLLESTQSDFNGQAGMGIVSAVGIQLSDLGFTGSEDFSVTAEFEPIEGLENVDQVGVFAGSSATTLTRAGIFQEATPQGLGVHTQSGNDFDATFDTANYDLSDGLTVTIAREGGAWSYLVDGIAVNPQTANATFLDGLSDLTVGVFAINPQNGNSKTVGVETFRVAVLSDELRETGIQKWKTEHFGLDPDAGIAGNGDDPDRDGRSNLIEYALGTNPLVGDGDLNSEISVAAGKLFWRFSRSGDPALIYKVMKMELPHGENAEVIWTSVAGRNLEGTAEVETEIGTGSDAKVFLQLSVETVE